MSFRAEAHGAEVEESIKKQISRLAFGSLEMTAYKVFNRAMRGINDGIVSEGLRQNRTTCLVGQLNLLFYEAGEYGIIAPSNSQ